MTHLRDDLVNLGELKRQVLSFARERDWEQFHSPKNLSMALAAEAAELMEHFLWIDSEASRASLAKKRLRAAIEEELADIVIYALEFANQTGVDMAAAIESKLKQNAIKYPVAKSKGRSVKYTEL
jgi:NTP pyrophosphatase (non-canonical NTP hydrolase)